MNLFWTLLSHLISLAGPALMLLYPLYASVKAIESESKLDDEQWLAYWIIYSFMTLMEMIAAPILYWIPIWYKMKLLLVAWLVLPQFRGASFIYERYVREKMKMYRAKAAQRAYVKICGLAGGCLAVKIELNALTLSYKPAPSLSGNLIKRDD